MIKSKLQKFWKDTSGAMTVEWVILGAAAILIAAGASAIMQTGSDGLVEDTENYFDNINNTANY